MEILFDTEEARVLGCLLEKEMATPEYYPLSLNALVNACNQKTNRNPVVAYDEQTVKDALQRLIDSDFAFESRLSRVPKYEELIMKKLNLVSREASILCTLLLRGPQTAGEIRARTERLYAFDSIDQVMDTMMDLEASGYLEKLSRQPGQKEDRYGHCFFPRTASGDRVDDGFMDNRRPPTPEDPVQQADPELLERLGILEETVQDLTDELRHLKQTFEDFRQQFE